MKQNLWKKATSIAMSIVLAMGLCPALAFASPNDLQAGRSNVTLQDETVSKFAYSGDEVKFIKADGAGFGMWAPQDGTKAELKDDKVEITYIPKNKTTYKGFYLDAGIDGIDTYSESSENYIAADDAGEYTIVLDKQYCGFAWPVVPVKKKGSGTTSDQYYLAVPSVDTLLHRTSLYPSNEEKMFKAVNAYIEPVGEGYNLVFSLSGTGYEYMFPGTYAQAVANGNDKSNWVKYEKTTVNCAYEDPDGKKEEGEKEKYQFTIKIADESEIAAIKQGTGQIKVPIVAISKSKASAAETANPSNPDYTEAFFARQAIIDLSQKQMVLGNYQDSFSAAVSSSLTTMPVDATGSLLVIGSPNANEYTVQPSFKTTGGIYDKAFKGSVTDAANAGDAALINVANEGEFVLPLYNSRDKGTTEIDTNTWQSQVAFHVSNSAPYVEAGTWVQRTITANPDAKTIVLSGAELTLKPVGLEVGKSETTGSGASAATVKATSADAVTYVAPAKKSTTSVTVPDTVTVNGKQYKVTKVASNAFKGSKAKSATIGKNVTTLSSKAFNGAKNLKKVTIKSKSLKSKKAVKNAFKGSKVKTVVLKGMTAKQKKAVKKAILKYGGKKVTVK